MKPLSFSLIAATLVLVGCTQSNKSSVGDSGTDATVQARERASATVDVGTLNRQLSAKMTFGSPAEVKGLLDQGATAEAKNRYGLPVIFMAAQRGEPAILNALIEAGADVNGQIPTSHNDDGIGYTGTVDGTPIGYAAAAGKVEAMEVLLQAGADVNGQGPAGTTALMRAAENGKLEAIRWLLNNGATAGRQEALGLAQLIVNPDQKYQEIIRLLSKP